MRPRTAEPPLRLDRFRRDSDGSDEGHGALLEKRNDDSMRYLIDFLKNTPPPENHKAIPQSCSSSVSEEGKWSKKFNIFRRKWRRESRKSSPPVIKLPDSAVAAKTIGGHRHISISIPYQFGHLGPASSSQYPVLQSTGHDLAREMGTRLGVESYIESLQPYTADRGIGTVLNPVAEDRESLMSGPPSLRSLASTERRESGKASCAAAGDGVSSPRGATGHRVLPEVQEVKESEVKPSVSLLQPNDQAASTTISPTTVVLRKLPSVSPQAPGENEAVGSSNLEPDSLEGHSAKKVHSRTTSTVSNSSTVISVNTTVTSWTVSDRRSSRKARESQEIGDFTLRNSSSNARRHPRSSFAESVATTDSEPRVFDAQAAKAYNTIPIVVQQYSRPPLDSPLNLNFPLPPLNSMGDSAETDEPAQPAVRKTSTRKERLREEKKQDTNAMEMEAHGDEYLSVIARLFEPNTDQICSDSELPVPGPSNDAGSGPSSESAPHKNKKVNFAPVVAKADNVPSISKSPPAEITISSEHGPKSNLTSATPTVLSPPAASHKTLDRTSSREWRKTWQAEPETNKERKRCYTVKAIVEQKGSNEHLSHQEMVARYGNIMEARFHNMEKGVQRLERNAEIWLRSMVPVMENLNRSLQEQYRYQRNENAWYLMNSATSSSSKALRTRSAERPESLAVYRSRDAARKPRPHTAGGEVRHRRSSGAYGLRETTLAPRPAVHTAFPRIFGERPRARRAADELDAHMGARVRRSRAGTKRHTTSFGSLPATDLIGIEPFMRGLRGTARFSMEEVDAITTPPAATDGTAARLRL